MSAPKKHPSARARANRASTAADIAFVGAPTVPDMPAESSWHPAAVRYWHMLWTSEMSPEWLDSDYDNVVICTYLYHDFWTATSATQRKEAAGELRLQRKSLGLDPMARRSLEWAIKVAGAADATAARRAEMTSQQPSAASDPRLALVQ